MSVPPEIDDRQRSLFRLAVDVVEAFVGQRRTGGEQCPQAVQAVAVARAHAGLLERRQVLGAGAEHGDVLGVDEVQQALGAGVERRAVVEHQAGAHRQTGGQPVPHHPAAGGVVEQPVAVAQVGVQAVLLEMLQEHAAGGMDDALGDSGGARRIEDVQRLLEGHRGEDRLALGLVEPVPQRDLRLAAVVLRLRLRTVVGHHQQLLQAGQAGEHLVELGGQVQRLAGVAVAGAGDQHARFDLAEAVDHTLGTEVRRAARPGRAEAGGGEHADHGLPGVRHQRGDPVAGAYAQGGEALLQARHVTGQFGVAEHLAATVFAHRDQRRGIIAAAQQVFGEIQRGAGEPARRGHLRAFLEDRTRRLLEAHLEEVDDGLPERLAPLHAPGMQRRVVDQAEGVPLVDEASEGLHATGGDAFGGRAPERCGHGVSVLVVVPGHAGSITGPAAACLTPWTGPAAAPASASRCHAAARR